MIAVIDFGSQYTQLIARRVREYRVYSEIYNHQISIRELADKNIEGLILSGGPGSVYQKQFRISKKFFDLGVPILGICYGMQLAAQMLGGTVKHCKKQEYGYAEITTKHVALFTGLPKHFRVWMSHGDEVTTLPPAFRVLAYTENSPLAVIGNGKDIFGLQFHPEVSHTPQGKTILQNFVYHVCGCKGEWTPESVISENVNKIREQVGEGRVVCALSGGVDSALAKYERVGVASAPSFGQPEQVVGNSPQDGRRRRLDQSEQSLSPELEFDDLVRLGDRFHCVLAARSRLKVMEHV